MNQTLTCPQCGAFEFDGGIEVTSAEPNGNVRHIRITPEQGQAAQQRVAERKH